MEWIQSIIDFIIHIDDHLLILASTYGAWTYAILFLIVFAETGFVVTPFLPGDSLLFAAGALAATGALNPLILLLVLFAAAVLGDSANFEVGSYFGIRLFKKDSKLFKLEYLHKTEHFFEKYGGKTIVIARFVPIVRTYAPFVAGASSMHYPKFISYNIIGGAVWVILFLGAGYLFGNIPVVKENFGLTVIVIIIASLIPMVVEFIKAKRKRKRA